jgi:hypothetical protein
MRTSQKAAIAGALSLAILFVTAMAGANTLAGGGEEAGGDGGGASAGMCAPGVPDCVDTVVIGDGGGSAAGACEVGATECVDIPQPPPADPDDRVAHDVDTEPGIIEPDPQVVEPTPGMVNVFPRPFDSWTTVDGDSLHIDFWSGVAPCSVLDRVDVTYGADAVTITLFEGADPSAGDVACIAIAELKRVVVTLAEPLGDRSVIDGAAA